MRDNRVNYVVVGSFTLIVLVGLVVSIALLTGRTGATDSYFTVLRSVPGIARGTQVLFQGYPVGNVDRISPLRREGELGYRVDLSVQKGWGIPADSLVYLTMGLLAAVNVNIDGGESQSLLEPGSEIGSRETSDIVETLTDVAGDANHLMSQVDSLLETKVKPLVVTVTEEIRLLSERLAALLSEENVEHVSRTVANFDEASLEASQLVQELRATRRAADAMIARLDSLADKNEENVDRILLDLRHALESIARHIDNVNRNLEVTSRNMNEFSREIRANPALLLRGRPPAEDSNGERP